MPAAAAAIILAAGLGTRMRSALPKALHPIAGRPMLRHLIAACEAVFERIVVVVGPGMPALEAAAAPHPTVVQAERLGTGHAALQGRRAVAEYRQRVRRAALVVPGRKPDLHRDLPFEEPAPERMLLEAPAQRHGPGVGSGRPAVRGDRGVLLA